MSKVGGLVGGLIQGQAAKKAGKQQAAAAKQQLSLREDALDNVEGLYEPFRAGGVDANNVLLYELGLLGEAPMVGATEEVSVRDALGNVRSYASRADAESALDFERESYTRNRAIAEEPYMPGGFGGQSLHRLHRDKPAKYDAYMNRRSQAADQIVGPNPFDSEIIVEQVGGTPYQGYELTPDYLFQRDEGEKAINRLAASRGGFNSGATAKALQRYSANIAGQGRNDYLNRLASVQGLGYGATNALAGAQQAFADGGSNALAQFGNAQAAGTIGQANGFAEAAINGFGIIEDIAGAAMGGGGGALGAIGGAGGFLNAFGGSGFGGGQSSFRPTGSTAFG